MPYYLEQRPSCWTTPGSPWWAAAGTGGFVAEGLCRLFQGRDATIVLVDHDRVEPHNLLRQNFYPADVGQFKSKALADRLSQAYNRSRGLLGLSLPRRSPSITAAAIPASPPTTAWSSAAPTTPPQEGRWPSACRETPAAGSSTPVTTPTGDRSLVGNVAHRIRLEEPPFTGDTCLLAPAPTLQRPDLLTAISTRPPDVDCAAALDLTDQDPTINQMMASLVLAGGPPHGGGDLPLPGPLPGHGPGHGQPQLRHAGGGGPPDVPD